MKTVNRSHPIVTQMWYFELAESEKHLNPLLKSSHRCGYLLCPKIGLQDISKCTLELSCHQEMTAVHSCSFSIIKQAFYLTVRQKAC